VANVLRTTGDALLANLVIAREKRTAIPASDLPFATDYGDAHDRSRLRNLPDTSPAVTLALPGR
jgi:hypothetical protein